MAGSGDDRRDFFISHAGPDTEWAEWVAQQLVDAGYTVELDVWDWAAGTNFVLSMQRALDRAARMIALLSPAYFERTWTRVEQHSAFIEQAQTTAGYLVPVIIARCDKAIPTLLRPLIAIDLVDLAEAEARGRLLTGIAGPRRPSSGEKARFPGTTERAVYPAGLPPVWNLPTRNLFFTGREGLLAELRQRLTAGHVAVSALQGTGGVGKSHLALEYAWRHATDYEIVWWINAEDPTGTDTAMAELAGVLGLMVEGGMAATVTRVRDHLGGHGGWLLIYDNVIDVDRLLPPGGGQVMVTCRDRRIGTLMPTLEVDTFDRSESVSLLRRRAPHLSELDADRIAAHVADLPLAVAQAAAYLAATGADPAAYLASLLATAASPDATQQAGPAATPAATAPAATQGLAGTVTTALAELASAGPAALDLLRQLAFLAPEPIPLTAVADDDRGVSATGGLVLGDPATTADKVAAITRLDLARSSGVHLQLHRRVQTLVRGSMPAEQRAGIFTGALRLLATANPGDPRDPASWPGHAELLPHLDAVVARLESIPVDEPPAFRRLLLATGRYLVDSGQFVAADATSRRTYDRYTQTLGPEHPDTLAAANNVAHAQRNLGQYEAARSLAEDVLSRRRQVLGDDHPDTLISASTLADILEELGTYREARDLDEDTLERRRRILGDDHPDTLASARELAHDLYNLGEHQAARELAEDTLARQRRLWGDDHPDSLRAAMSLAAALSGLGEYRAARDLDEDTLARFQRVLGHDHPRTLRAVINLALDRAALGDHRGARDLLNDVIPRMRRVLGDDHPETRQTQWKLRLTRLRVLGPLARSTASLQRYLGKHGAPPVTPVPDDASGPV